MTEFKEGDICPITKDTLVENLNGKTITNVRIDGLGVILTVESAACPVIDVHLPLNAYATILLEVKDVETPATFDVIPGQMDIDDIPHYSPKNSVMETESRLAPIGVHTWSETTGKNFRWFESAGGLDLKHETNCTATAVWHRDASGELHGKCHTCYAAAIKPIEVDW